MKKCESYMFPDKCTPISALQHPPCKNSNHFIYTTNQFAQQQWYIYCVFVPTFSLIASCRSHAPFILNAQDVIAEQLLNIKNLFTPALPT